MGGVYLYEHNTQRQGRTRSSEISLWWLSRSSSLAEEMKGGLFFSVMCDWRSGWGG